MSDIINLQSSVPILQQAKSSIIKNELIPNESGKIEQVVIVSENKFQVKRGISLINENISKSILGVTIDFFDKDKNITWIQHFKYIFTKDQRYKYIGLFLIMIAFFIYITKSIYRNSKQLINIKKIF